MPSRKVASKDTPGQRLEALVDQAIAAAKMARKHNKPLAGDNFYANKMNDLRAEAVNAFEELSAGSAGNTSALAELIEAVFSPKTATQQRAEAARETVFSLRTTWKMPSKVSTELEAIGLIPLSVLSETKKSYLITLGRQMNGAFSKGWYDACSVMMRRLLEVSIIEAFEKKKAAARITDPSGDYLQLTRLINATLVERTLTLSRNVKRALPRLRDLGHRSAHGRYFLARKDDVERHRDDFRLAIEELLHHANLL